MSVNHEYKIISLVKTSEVGDHLNVISSIRGQLVSTIEFSHTYTDEVWFDEDQQRLESPIEQEVTEDKTILEVCDYSVDVSTSDIDPSTFVDFDSLTEEIVLSWLGSDSSLEEQNQTILEDKKDRIINPKKYELSVVQAPWISEVDK